MRGLATPLCRTATVLLAMSALAMIGRAAAAGVDPKQVTVIRVEEDWKLVVTEPNADTASPQVSTQMKRDPNSQKFCNVHLNARDIPTYGEGGLQLQAWKDSASIGSATSESMAVMQTPNETITWTQYLRLNSGQVLFGVSAASSQTWGDFSGVEIPLPNSLASLDNYSINYSAQNSGVTFGANRVAYFGIQRLRTYYSDGTVQTDSTERVVYPSGSGN